MVIDQSRHTVPEDNKTVNGTIKVFSLKPLACTIPDWIKYRGLKAEFFVRLRRLKRKQETLTFYGRTYRIERLYQERG